MYVDVFCGSVFFEKGVFVHRAPASLLRTLGLSSTFRIALTTPDSLHLQIYFRTIKFSFCFWWNYSDVLQIYAENLSSYDIKSSHPQTWTTCVYFVLFFYVFQ